MRQEGESYYKERLKGLYFFHYFVEKESHFEGF